jgi:hypothetical protein
VWSRLVRKATADNLPEPAPVVTRPRSSSFTSWFQVSQSSQELPYARTIRRVMAVMCYAYDIAMVDDAVGAQLGRVALNAAPASTGSSNCT